MSDGPRTGSGDPQRTLDLLWGARERPTRGPKPGLTVERIVQAAVELADADGLAALSMRKVAERLGVGTMSLYRYVPGKAELLDLMYDHAVGEQPRTDPEGDDWRAQLTTVARITLATYRRHPWMLDVVAGNRPPLGPHVMDAYEVLLAILRRTGLPPAETQAAVSLLSNYVAGAAREVVAAARAEAETGISDEQWWQQRESFWEQYFDPERYPTIVALYALGALDEPLDPFAFGLERVLDGIAARIAASDPVPDAPAGSRRSC